MYKTDRQIELILDLHKKNQYTRQEWNRTAIRSIKRAGNTTLQEILIKIRLVELIPLIV